MKNPSTLDPVLLVRLGIILFSMVGIMVTGVSGGNASESACQPPTVSQAGKCVLTKDAFLQSTLEIRSNTTLDCKGHTIRPKKPGLIDDAFTPKNEFKPPKPGVAVFLNHAYKANVQNCNIQGFDFGILSFNAKRQGEPPQGNKIRNNTINARARGIYLLNVDDHLVVDNTVRYLSEWGHGILVDMDSDNNQIIGNTITNAEERYPGFIQDVPGLGNVTFEFLFELHADNAIEVLGGMQDLYTLVINGTVYQLAFHDNFVADELNPENNVILNNIITHNRPDIFCSEAPATACTTDDDCVGTGFCPIFYGKAGVAVTFLAHDTTIGDNTINGGRNGIRSGGSINFPVLVPGHCKKNTARLCTSNAECNIRGIDDKQDDDNYEDENTKKKKAQNKEARGDKDHNRKKPKDKCVGVLDPWILDDLSQYEGPFIRDDLVHGLLAENNVVTGQKRESINLPDFGGVARGNLIAGQGKTQVGMALYILSIETAVIERNIITGTNTGLLLTHYFWEEGESEFNPDEFSAKISLNDFSGNVVNVQTTDEFAYPEDTEFLLPYTFPSGLFVNGKGNYWGHTCGEDDGFIEAGKPGEDSTHALVIDSYPYGQPVADVPDGSLPATCLPEF